MRSKLVGIIRLGAVRVQVWRTGYTWKQWQQPLFWVHVLLVRKTGPGHERVRMWSLGF